MLVAVSAAVAALEETVGQTYDVSGNTFLVKLVDKVQWRFLFFDEPGVNICSFDLTDGQVKKFRVLYARAKARANKLKPGQADDVGSVPGAKIAFGANNEVGPCVRIWVVDGSSKLLFNIELGAARANTRDFERILAVTNQ